MPETPPATPLLLIDGTSEERCSLETSLAPLGRPLEGVRTFRQALERLEASPFAAIVLDARGVDASGATEAVRRLREVEAARRVPLLVVGARGLDTAGLDAASAPGRALLVPEEAPPDSLRAQARLLMDLHAAEAELGERERRFCALLASLPQLVWVADPEGRVEYLNTRWFEYMGIPPGRASAVEWSEVLHPEDLDRVVHTWARARARREPYETECRFRRADGVWRWFNARAVPELDGAGTILRWVGTSQDITEQKQAEAERNALLARAEVARTDAESERAHLHSVLMQAPTAIALLEGPRHVVTLANPMMRALWRRDADLLLGRPLFEVFPELRVQGEERLLESVFTTGAPFVGKERPIQLRRKPGGDLETVYFNFVCEPLRDARGVITGIAVVASEVTQQVDARRAVEEHVLKLEHVERELQEAVRVRDEFLSVASHELRTPLTPLGLRLQALRRETDGQPDSDFVRRVRQHTDTGLRQVRKLGELVGDLLDVSRIMLGRLRLTPEDVDWADVVREVAGRYEPQAARSGSTLEVNAGTPVVGHWDRMRLEQVVTNLLDNALKYGMGRPVHVALDTRGDKAVLTVRDEGIGIEPQHRSRIFGRFERAVSERHYGGLGLGLYITCQIVESHGGGIRVESEPGHGSTFVVTLPLTEAPPPLPGPPAPPAPPGTP